MIIGILHYYSSKGVLPYGNDSFFCIGEENQRYLEMNCNLYLNGVIC